MGADRRPFALIGNWYGGGALIGSDPIVEGTDGDDPFELVDRVGCREGWGDLVGACWVGYFGYQLGASIERLPQVPRRPVPVPHASLAFYDHLLRYDAAEDRWWFEAMWTEGRAAALEKRFRLLSGRLREPPARRRRQAVAPFHMVPHPRDHKAAVARCIEYIRAGDIFQANLCLRLEAPWQGDALPLFCDAVDELGPPYAAFLAHSDGQVLSLSPELFLRRTGRQVVTAPIKGTARRDDRVHVAEQQRDRLLASSKDRAENVMIVDLMRNDLGRVCEPGSVRVPSLVSAERHPGVWHLVSEVSGCLRAGVTDGDLLRATFPPGSVTGAPKVRAMEIISELEATAREVYTGAIGCLAPLAGLELNVAIRTFEIGGGRIWLGVGGGVVADSRPEEELAECLAKAGPLLGAIGSRLADE